MSSEKRILLARPNVRAAAVTREIVRLVSPALSFGQRENVGMARRDLDRRAGCAAQDQRQSDPRKASTGRTRS